MLMESRLVGELVVHLGCRMVQVLNHLNRKWPLWYLLWYPPSTGACFILNQCLPPPASRQSMARPSRTVGQRWTVTAARSRPTQVRGPGGGGTAAVRAEAAGAYNSIGGSRGGSSEKRLQWAVMPEGVCLRAGVCRGCSRRQRHWWSWYRSRTRGSTVKTQWPNRCGALLRLSSYCPPLPHESADASGHSQGPHRSHGSRSHGSRSHGVGRMLIRRALRERADDETCTEGHSDLDRPVFQQHTPATSHGVVGGVSLGAFGRRLRWTSTGAPALTRMHAGLSTSCCAWPSTKFCQRCSAITPS